MLSTHLAHPFIALSLHILQDKDESWSEQYTIYVHGATYTFLNLIPYYFCSLGHFIGDNDASRFTTMHHIQFTNNSNTYSCKDWNNPMLSQNKDTPEK